MKSAFVAVGVVAGVCAAYLGATAVSGQQVEKKLRAATVAAQAQWPMFKVADERYERGLFSATHTLTLRSGCEAPDAGASAPKATTVTVVQHIQHGPFPAFAGFGAATLDTEIVWDQGSRKNLKEVFGTADPLKVHTDVAFSGASHTHFTLANFHHADAKVKEFAFLGVSGDVDVDDHGFEYDVRAPGLTVAGLTDAPDAAASEPEADAGDPAAAIAAAAASAPDAAASAPTTTVHMSFKNAHLHGRSEGTGDFALRPSKGQGELESAELEILQPAGAGKSHKVSFSQFKFSQDTALDKGLMNAVARFEGKGQVDDTKLDKIESQMTMKRLNAVAYQEVLRRFTSDDAASCGKAPAVDKLMQSPEVQAALVRMLTADPEVSLDKLALEIGGKRAELGYAIGVKGFTAEDAKTMQASLMSRGYGDAHIKLPADWIEQGLTYVAQQSGQTSDLAGQVMMVNIMLEKVISQGYVVREDGVLHAEFAFKNGAATVNGKPLFGGPPARPAGKAAAL